MEDDSVALEPKDSQLTVEEEIIPPSVLTIAKYPLCIRTLMTIKGKC